jgi:hypothetical protein
MVSHDNANLFLMRDARTGQNIGGQPPMIQTAHLTICMCNMQPLRRCMVLRFAPFYLLPAYNLSLAYTVCIPPSNLRLHMSLQKTASAIDS